jgi:hypothetical protein
MHALTADTFHDVSTQKVLPVVSGVAAPTTNTATNPELFATQHALKVTGGNNEFTAANGKGPLKVMCWQEDRDGGGWTLAMKNYHGSHHSFAGSGRRQTNNVNSGVMAHLGAYYKMDDRHIRSYMGQSDPLNDDNTAKSSEFSILRDQNGRHTSYAVANREYTIMKKYKHRWYFQEGQPLGESESESVLQSWYWDGNYDGSTTAMGDGKLNWEGKFQHCLLLPAYREMVCV